MATDSGFSMVEVIVSLIVIALAASAAAVFFIGNIGGINGEKQRQNAVNLANQQMEQITSLTPANLVYGRTQAAVSAIWASAAATRLKISSQDDETNSADYDSNAAHTSPYVPTTLTRTIDNINYTLTNFIDVCWMNASSGICGPTSASNLDKEFRASVDVAWTSDTPCAKGCDYSTSTLIDPTADPVYNSNISAPIFQSLSPAAVNVYNMNATCSGSNPGTLVTVNATGLVSGASVRISKGGGSIASSTVSQSTGANQISFCLLTADAPGSYTLSVINPDGGHLQTSITETGHVDSASFSSSGNTLTLSGGGFEANGVLTDSSGETWATTPVIASNGASNWNGSTYSPDTITVTGYTPPSNGGTDTLTLTNPDTSTVTYTITAPNQSGTVTGYAGVSNNVTITGTGFQTGATFALSSGNCSNVSGGVTSSTSATLTFKGGTSGAACGFKIVNPDGGYDTFSASVIPVPITVTSASPNPTGATGGTTYISIVGTGFETGMAVSVSPASICTTSAIPLVTSSTTAQFTISPIATGTCVITLANSATYGSGTRSFNETIDVQPTISSVTGSGSWVHGSALGTLTVNGTNFASGATVAVVENIAGVNYTIFSATSGYTLTGSTKIVVTPTLQTGSPVANYKGSATFSVTVTNPDGVVTNSSTNYVAETVT